MTQLLLTIDSRTLTYQMVPGPLTDLWLNLMYSVSDNLLTWHEFRQVDLQAPGSRSWAQHTLDQICARMAIRYQDLNDLHLQFQQQMEQEGYTDDWAKINDLVHQLEQPDSRHVARLRFYLDYQNNNTVLPLIPPELRPLWSHQAQSGDLRLGYHTVGKTLWHACKDQDVGVVRDRQLRPQETISTEMLFFWGRSDPKNNDDRQFLIGQWLSREGLTDCVDVTDPRHQYHGEPLLARLIDPDPRTVLTWITPHSQVEQFQIVPSSRG